MRRVIHAYRVRTIINRLNLRDVLLFIFSLTRIIIFAILYALNKISFLSFQDTSPIPSWLGFFLRSMSQNAR